MTIPAGLQNGPVYLDYNATTPVDPRVAEAFLPHLTEHFGNPSSSHRYGRTAKAAVTAARASVGGLLGAAPAEVVFTGGGSDSDTLAIRGAVLAGGSWGKHVITQATEHPAVLAVCASLQRLHGTRITYLPVDHHGLVDPADLESALTKDTVLVSIMHANNETGAVQPIRELADRAHRVGALLHTDASQSAGKLPVSVADLGADMLTITGHKMYAPKGVGALYVRNGLDLEPSTYGGGQEGGLRGGTENVAMAVALGRAAELVADLPASEPRRVQRLRDLLHDQLTRLLPGRVHLNGHPDRRLPNTLNISIDNTIGPELLAATPAIAASTGSACHDGTTEPSPVLTAMGLSNDRTLAALRLTIGRWSTDTEITAAAQAIANAVHTGPR
ncbi:cysteine desulfurase family protein [Amycolatopsis palatopharyngis]|uniref:cysteine desulfurase family protein n=1 Tax=Amycolatopsis palatopharyngis TaxID=187982 RepID=UPI000E2399DE|nr:cysteine desulfurase family protein [Amycolatopsis palatopharyngis]